MTAIVEWALTETMIGVGIITAIAYGVGALVGKVLRRPQTAIIVAAVAFVAALFTVPSYARYQFEKTGLGFPEQYPGFRLVKATRWGDLTEPLTFIWPPIGHFRYVAPNDPPDGGFQEVVLRYEESPLVLVIQPVCDAKTMALYTPGDDGMLTQVGDDPVAMSGADFDLYCVSDWSSERQQRAAGN